MNIRIVNIKSLVQADSASIDTISDDWDRASPSEQAPAPANGVHSRDA